MPLILTMTPAGPPARGADRQIRTLAHGSLSIGRAPGNDWVLADPEQHLSRSHCMVSYDGARCVLTDLSTNGMLINGAREPTTRNSRTVLTDGDSVRLGDWLLEIAEADEAAARAGAGPFGGGSFVTAPLAPAAEHDPLGDDPLDDPFAAGAGRGFQHPLPHPPPALRGEDPFDLARGGERDDDLFGGRASPDAFSGPAQPDHADARAQAYAAPRVIQPPRPQDIDFDALIGDLSPQPATPPQPAAPPPPPPVPAAATPPAHNPAAAALLAAFLEGAGMPRLDLSAGDPEATMRAIGALFRAMVEGTREVLMSRAEIKQEMRVERTILRARDNNALKFSVTPEEAMVALLQPGRPGYKPPLAAVDEAFKDIRSHEMAVMAGLQTALATLLKRFDPASLEARLQRGMLDAILPGARKARFWELFCTTYNDIAREAQDDFHSSIGRSFAQAYDAQMGKL